MWDSVSTLLKRNRRGQQRRETKAFYRRVFDVNADLVSINVGDATPIGQRIDNVMRKGQDYKA